MPTNQRELGATENVLNQEPVNQQMLAALDQLVSLADNGACESWRPEWDSARAAIAAAEAAHSGHNGDPDPKLHAVPEEQEQLQLAETEVINAKAWSVGEEAKKHCKYALTAIAVARAQLSAAQKPEGGE